MEMGREERLESIGFDMETMVNVYCIDDEIEITYHKLKAGDEAAYTEWTKQRFHLQFGGSEYFFIYRLEKQESPSTEERKSQLLYVVNITADSYLTAAKELMTLLANKF